MVSENRVFEIPRAQIATLANGCKTFAVVFGFLGITFPFLTIPTHDAGLTWIAVIAVALFALIVGILLCEAHVFQKCLVWRAELRRDGVTLHTLAEQIFAPWNEMDSIGKQAGSHGHTQFILRCKRGEPYRLPATLDKTEQLFDQIRANITTPSLRQSMYRILQCQTIVALPITLGIFAWIANEIPYLGWGFAVLSVSTFLFLCMFLCLDYDVSDQRVKLRSPLACYDYDWRSIRPMKLSSYVRTSQGCFFFSGWLLDHEMLKQTIRIRCANQRNLLTEPELDSTKADLGYNRSGFVVAILSLAAGFAPLFGSVYVAPVAAFGAVVTLLLGKKQPILSILCLLVSIPGVIAPLTVPDFVSPGKPAVLRLIDVSGSVSPLSQFVTLGPVQDLYGYQLNPPDWTSKFLSLSGEHGKLDKWRGRDIVLGMYELTFMVAQEHASSNDVGSARYEWSHPELLSNISRVDSRKQEFDGLTFTINEWTATCGPIKFYGFDYIATNNGAMIAFRSFDGRQAYARARAEAVMKTFHRTATAGIPTKSPPVAPAIRSQIDAATSNSNAHAGKKSHHRKAKGVDHSGKAVASERD